MVFILDSNSENVARVLKKKKIKKKKKILIQNL